MNLFHTKTIDGKRLVVNVDLLRKNTPNCHYIMLLIPLTPMVVLLMPMIMYFGQINEDYGWRLLFSYIVGWLVFSIVHHYLVFKAKNLYGASMFLPMTLSHRLCLSSSLFWFLLAEPKYPFVFIFLGFIFIYCEYQNYKKVNKATDAEVIKSYKNCFVLNNDGDYALDVSRARNKKLYQSYQKEGTFLYYFENLGGMVIATLGCGITIFSLELGNNFDVRFMLAGWLLIFLGLSLRFVMVPYSFIHRVIKLKQLGKF